MLATVWCSPWCPVLCLHHRTVHNSILQMRDSMF